MASYRVTFHTTFVVDEDSFNERREEIGLEPVTFYADAAEDEAADLFESVFGFFPGTNNWSATVEEIDEQA